MSRSKFNLVAFLTILVACAALALVTEMAGCPHSDDEPAAASQHPFLFLAILGLWGLATLIYLRAQRTR